jgi:hypothetical protein
MRRWILGLLVLAVVGYAVAATVIFVFFPEESTGPAPTPVTVNKTITVIPPSGQRHSAATEPPRYQVCGRVSLGFIRTPLYAHNTSCAVAIAVAKRCSGSRKEACFGQFPLPYNGVGEPSLPEAPLFKPLGFECYQAFAPYTAGLPPSPRMFHEPKPILCHRESGNASSAVQQLVAYIL